MRIANYSAVAAVLLLAAPLVGQEDTPAADLPGPLFTSHDMLELTIEAPFKTVFKEREQESSYHPAVLKFPAADGSVDSMDIDVKTRGKFRLDRSNCNFPPIRVRFSGKRVAGTVFDGEDRLKLVTHCDNRRSEYEQQVILEYLVYRTLNVLTDLSLRVRLARITYVDLDEDRDSLTRYAFFIEDEDKMAQRVGWASLEVQQVSPWNYDQEQLSLVDVFQYMVANTDWDAFGKADDQEFFCHNLKVIGNLAGPVFPVPYDFDWTGLVNRRYAKPDPTLPIRSVRQRLYRGVCRERADVEVVFPLFNQKQAEIYDLFRNQTGLEPKRVEQTLEYLDEFYEVINDPGKVNSRMLRDCRRTRQ
jgi:hypothetical protein